MLGHAVGVRDGKVILASDLLENLRKADQAVLDRKNAIDQLIEERGMDVPPNDLAGTYWTDPGSEPKVLIEVSLRASEITNVVWATGYRFDFSLVQLPITDEYGYPIQTRGITEYPGLYFLGLHRLHFLKSDLLLGVGQDTEFLAGYIAGRQ